MGSSASKSKATAAVEAAPAPPLHVNTTIDAVVAADKPAAAEKKGKARHSTASAPVGNKEVLRIQTKQVAPPVWDPRSPNMKRTPKKEAREIRASLIAQEQLAKALADLSQSDDAKGRRNTTQISAIPSMRALLEQGRVGPAASPKRLQPRIELEPVRIESTKAKDEEDVNPEAVNSHAPPMPSAPKAASSAPSPSPVVVETSVPVVRKPRPSGFNRPSGCMSPLSEFVETEFMKSYESPSKRFGGPLFTAHEECKEEK